MPDLKFRVDAKFKKQIRATMRAALAQSQQEIQNVPVGVRIHVQSSTEGFTEEQHAAARTGRKVPLIKATEIANMFLDSATGILVTDQTKVVQFLCTTGWGEKDAVQVSTWALDLERKDGVQ